MAGQKHPRTVSLAHKPPSSPPNSAAQRSTPFICFNEWRIVRELCWAPFCHTETTTVQKWRAVAQLQTEEKATKKKVSFCAALYFLLKDGQDVNSTGTLHWQSNMEKRKLLKARNYARLLKIIIKSGFPMTPSCRCREAMGAPHIYVSCSSSPTEGICTLLVASLKAS